MNTLNADYWNNRHQAGDTPWDIKMPSPPITSYIDQLKDKNISILIPGAGHSHEATYLIDHGFENITVCDISEVAIQKMKLQMNNRILINYLNIDFFVLDGTFDLIIEQTFFCAIDPVFRSKYVDKMSTLLKPDGKLVGVLFGIEFPHKGPHLVDIYLNTNHCLVQNYIFKLWKYVTTQYLREWEMNCFYL